MNIKLNFTLLAFMAALSFSACKSDKDTVEITGCKDPQSVNYNPNATKDNGGCQYLSDIYAGNYLVKDTITYSFNGQTDTYYEQYSFSIAKTGNNSVKMNGFNNGANVDATASNTSIVPLNAGNSGIGSFIGTFDGQRIRYTYETGSAGPTLYHRGTATKQK